MPANLIAILAAVTGAQPVAPSKTIVVPDTAAATPFVEQAIDHGDTVELVVRCAKGTAAISFSKSSRQFCARDQRCTSTLAEAAAWSCA